MQLNHLMKIGKQHLMKRLAETVYLNTGYDATKPISIRGHINDRCNYKCRYCNFWRLENYPEEMSIAQWQTALLSLKKFIGSYLIQFCGGEPFIKKGFIDLLEFCYRQDIDWGVITNGSMFDHQTVKRVVASRPTKIDISVDSSISEIHDFSRGIPGSLKKIEQGIIFLREERERLGLNFLIRIKPTVHKHNFRYLPQLVEWTQNIGATTIDFAPVRPTNNVPEVTTELWLKDEIDQIDLAQIVETLIAMQQQGSPIETSKAKLSGFVDHFRGKLVYHGVSPCRVSLREYRIQANGDVTMCWFYPLIGNVKDNDAKEIWYSEEARKLRAQMVACQKFGSVDCSNSCLTHRTLAQKVQLGRLFLHQANKQPSSSLTHS